MTLPSTLKSPIRPGRDTPLALIWFAMLWPVMLVPACTRGSKDGSGGDPVATAPAVMQAAGGEVAATETPAARTPQDFGETAAKPLGTGVLVCDKYIRMVCGCAQKRQAASLQKACDLARQSLPDWQRSHKEEGEELAVIKACQRAFLYIQSTGQCDDISY